MRILIIVQVMAPVAKREDTEGLQDVTWKKVGE